MGAEWRRVLRLGALLALATGAGVGAEGLPLRADSLLAIADFVEPDTLLEYGADGELRGSLEVDDPGALIDHANGVAIAGGTLWVAARTGVVRVDPATGAVTPGFEVSESALLTGLADDGDTLLVMELAPDRVHRFTLDGQLLETVGLPGGLLVTGVDTDGVLLYATSHNTGHVHVFTMDGMPVGVVELGLTGDLTGVTLAADGASLWVAAGTGVNDILHVDFAGNVLGGFPGEVQGVMGLHAVPGPLFADGFEAGDLAAWSQAQP